MTEAPGRKHKVRQHGPKRPPDVSISSSVPAARASGMKLIALAAALTMAGAANAQVLGVHPSINSRLTYSDNINVSDGEKEGDWVAEVTPGIVVSRDKGRITGNLDARLRSVHYGKSSERNTTFLAMQGRGQVEAVEDTLFLEAGATVSRNNRSALTGRASRDELGTDKANETRTFFRGPRLNFRLGHGTEGVARYVRTWFDGGGATLGRTVGDTHLRLSDPIAFGRFGWGFDYARSDTTYNDLADDEVSEETIRAILFLTVSEQFRLRGIVGRESNDFAVRSGESGTIVGAGFDWKPTPRTTVSGEVEDRIFGRGYNLEFSHRRPLSAWQLQASRNITSSVGTDGSVFDDPAFRSLYDSLAGEIPDPIEREDFVRQQLGYPAPGVRDAFVTNNHFVARTLRGSVSLIGARNVLTLSLQQADRSRLGTPLVSDSRDDFATFDTIKTRSATISLSHRLSPRTSVNTSLLRSRATGSGGSSAETRRTLFLVGLSTRLGIRTSAGLGYRHQRAAGTTDFTENIVTASLGMQF